MVPSLGPQLEQLHAFPPGAAMIIFQFASLRESAYTTCRVKRWQATPLPRAHAAHSDETAETAWAHAKPFVPAPLHCGGIANDVPLPLPPVPPPGLGLGVGTGLGVGAGGGGGAGVVNETMLENGLAVDPSVAQTRQNSVRL